MEENIFASFVPITASDGQDTEALRNYYMENNITPQSAHLKKYLNWPAETVVPSSVTTPSISQPSNFDIGKLLGNTTFTANPAVVQSTEPITVQSSSKTSQPVTKNPKDYMAKYGATAKKAAIEAGFSPELILAQIALETGYGEHAPGNNFGGIKAGKSWKGKTQTLMTKEFENGKYVRKPQTFRAYDSPEEGFKGYIDFLASNKRYANLKGVTDPQKAAELMGKSGYATDPNYTTSLKNVMKTIQNT